MEESLEEGREEEQMEDQDACLLRVWSKRVSSSA